MYNALYTYRYILHIIVNYTIVHVNESYSNILYSERSAHAYLLRNAEKGLTNIYFYINVRFTMYLLFIRWILLSTNKIIFIGNVNARLPDMKYSSLILTTNNISMYNIINKMILISYDIIIFEWVLYYHFKSSIVMEYCYIYLLFITSWPNSSKELINKFVELCRHYTYSN